jgi:hypothetical protein
MARNLATLSIEVIDQSAHLPLLPTRALSCISPGDPFVVELMPPEGTFVVVGTVFPFTVHTATKVRTSKSIRSGGYWSGLCIQIALATTTVSTMIVP